MKPATPLSLLATALALTIPAAPVHAEAPDCLYADSDADGDGWGWENHRSCIVSGSSASTTAANAQSVEQQPVQQQSGTNPVCSSANADSDGDGWGWENNASCIVVASTSQPVTNTLVTPVAEAPPVADTLPEAETLTAVEILPVAETPVAVETPAVAETPVVPQTLAAVSAIPETINPDIVNGLYRGRHQICSSPSADADGDGWGFEFHESCKVVVGYIAPGTPPPIPPDGNNPNKQIGVIYDQNFDASATGLYQADQLNSEWQSPIWHLGFDQGRVSVVDTGGRNGNAMQVTYPAGRYGAAGSSSFLSDVQFGMGLPKTYEELYVAYDIRFAVDFDFVKGGKLPGLCGADVNQAPHTGCNTGGGYPTGYDGWSARGMWRENGILENYVYHASQRNFYGDDELWNVSATPGVWHRVEHRVVLNTPGQKNGILEAWFDGTKVLSLNNMEYRKTNTIGINLFYFNTFFGGNDISWAPSTDQTMNFDNFVMSTNKID